MFLHAEIKGTAGYCSSKRTRSPLVSKGAWYAVSSHRICDIPQVSTAFGSHRLLQINRIFVMVIMLVVAVTVVTMLLAMLEAMLEGAKSAQGHSAVYCASLGGVGIMLLLPEKPWICSLRFRENIHFENGLLLMQVD